ncbi:hypothetical protein MJO29_004163 [Puccinia striiformis f. sp. tritici]|nr:hypothetical protein Pst134EA_007262 [Puccinia striiformis f. sp. tritici]KAH9469996.1 hypothetical protein Pst134EA_007262 [Puccinia striiformis f. sp. tritici]KAI7963736.1 hypothetical protein MJO29_004163 [Puccinia striiformis f. sp. tritici]
MRDAWERVMVARNKFRIHVLTPLGAILKDAYKTYPALTSYMMVLTRLSVIPIIAFVGFSMFAGSIVAGMGLAFVLGERAVLLMSCLTGIDDQQYSQVVKELVNHANEKRLHHQQNRIDENVKSA